MGRFINGDAFASTGQGILGNNMFAYCGNNPVNYLDPYGTYPRREKFPVCIDFNDNNYEPTLAEYIKTIAKPLDFTMDELLQHTSSIGIAGFITNGNVSLGKSICISGDYYGNFALQETSSNGVSTGSGGSVALIISFTNAGNVQDLSGTSYGWGCNLVFLKGATLEIIYFEPTPGEVKWGITLGYSGGVELSGSINENYTTSTESWHIWDLFT